MWATTKLLFPCETDAMCQGYVSCTRPNAASYATRSHIRYITLPEGMADAINVGLAVDGPSALDALARLLRVTSQEFSRP